MHDNNTGPLQRFLHEDRLFPSDPATRAVARRLYATVRDLPIISPHGHTDARWFADDQPFPNPAALFIAPDHYIFRMFYSQGIQLESLGIRGCPADPREVWRIFARNYYLFRGTPTRMWLDYSFATLFGCTELLTPANADEYYDRISEHLSRAEFRPRALFDRFHIEVLTTTDSPNDSLDAIQSIRKSGWKGRILPAFRPDPVVDPDFHGFKKNIIQLGKLTGENTASWQGYLQALRMRRQFFKSMGATSTDHGHPTARTADLNLTTAKALFKKVFSGKANPKEQELFRAQMLTEMAGMSAEDGLVMQLHPGSVRNYNPVIYEKFGRDMGADIPQPTDYVNALRPLLAKYGNHSNFTLVLFTIDETSFSRELAPLAGHYPSVRLGPPWWFLDSPEGMMRFREAATETAGFYNTVGFNDDTRAFLSIPARHDVARRVDSAFLARLVVEHRLNEDEAVEVIRDLTVGLVRKAYRL
jgi:glucuronate isomerase